jgi:hypothetical protein
MARPATDLQPGRDPPAKAKATPAPRDPAAAANPAASKSFQNQRDVSFIAGRSSRVPTSQVTGSALLVGRLRLGAEDAEPFDEVLSGFWIELLQGSPEWRQSGLGELFEGASHVVGQ